ncbi:MAG: hypothetical protein ACD_22C00069G0002 [uncultured bacterium]|nr:MAG: hypothetical protein ACD_22C00069G0002 [uncultured bacterium]
MIKRTILEKLSNHLKEPEMTVLIGPRQVGKTYIMRLLQEQIEKDGGKTVFLNLDVMEHKKYFESQTSLLNYIRLQVGDKPAFIFIDEIQRKENAGLFLKGIYDLHYPYKFIVSGSGSLDLKAKIRESMAGRKHLFSIEPISFEEFTNYKTNYKYEDRLEDFLTIEKTQAQNLLEEYMMYGGYPKVVLAETTEKKKEEIEEIYKSYIERDIEDLLGVEKPEALTNLLKVLASQIGGLVNIHELSITIGISSKTISNYLWYLEETFIIKKITPYYTNIRSEITKTPIYYFFDTGMRNFILGLFGLATLPTNYSGHLFENVIYNILRQHTPLTPTSIHFWRTTDNAEVDFVINSGLKIIPVETKYATLKQTESTRSFKSFLTKYNPSNAYIVHLGVRMTDSFENTGISFLPFYECHKIMSKM